MSAPRTVFAFLAASLLSLSQLGCGGGAAGPAPSPDVQDVLPAGQSLAESGPEVEIYTASERLVIQGFRIDFPKFRNIHEVIGFIPEDWDRLVRIPFTDLRELQIRSIVDQTTFEKIYKYREQYSVNADEFFRVQLLGTDGRTIDFVAMIPKFRGIKDSLVWDQPMRSNPLRIDRVVFQQ